MTRKQLERRLGFIVGDLYRLRMATEYAKVGRAGANEMVLAEALLYRTVRRLRGEDVGRLPRTLREIKAELQEDDDRRQVA